MKKEDLQSFAKIVLAVIIGTLIIEGVKFALAKFLPKKEYDGMEQDALNQVIDAYEDGEPNNYDRTIYQDVYNN